MLLYDRSPLTSKNNPNYNHLNLSPNNSTIRAPMPEFENKFAFAQLRIFKYLGAKSTGFVTWSTKW
jgi:hypothetical protein